MEWTPQQRVAFKSDRLDRRVKGVITSIVKGGSVNGKVRVKTDLGTLEVVPVKRLRPPRDEALVLESMLDGHAGSEREQTSFMKALFKVYDLKCHSQDISTPESLRCALKDAASKHKHVRFVHIVAHGCASEKGRSSALNLAYGQVDLRESVEIFKGLDGKIIVFSCCEVGLDRVAMTKVKDVSGARAVIAYNRDVSDEYSYVAEHLLYDRLIRTTRSPEVIVREVGRAVHQLGIRSYSNRRHLLTCY